ncbi:hypothetical protein GQ44DRAFT_761640 [Phaeosphaeriaceae sp. PMI808]|nr:hypothetical protein GQ44DRAFT_761640 [Phaeosphaeriaceae sp. PMI808]
MAFLEAVTRLQLISPSIVLADKHQHQPHIANNTTPHDAHNNTEPHENANDYFRKRQGFEDSKNYRLDGLVRRPATQAMAMYRTVQQSLNPKYPVYFADAVERCALSASIEASKQTKKTVAYDQISALLEIDKKKGGAASLYSIACSPSDITQLNESEIKALCEYRIEKMLEVEKVSRDADIDVVKSLRDDLRAQGFVDTDIKRGNTRLTRLICEILPNSEDIQQNASAQQSNQGIFRKLNEQLKRCDFSQTPTVQHIIANQCMSTQSILGSPGRGSVIAALVENSVVFYLENPSISARKPNKRKKKILEGHGRPITSNTEVSTSSRTSIPEPRYDGSATQAEAEGNSTPILIADSVVADNNSSYSPRASSQDGPEHLRPTILPSLTSREPIDHSATALIGDSGEEYSLAKLARQTLPPFEVITPNNESTAATLTTTDADRSLTNVNSTRKGPRTGSNNDNANFQEISGMTTEGVFSQRQDTSTWQDAVLRANGNPQSLEMAEFSVPECSWDDGPDGPKLSEYFPGDDAERAIADWQSSYRIQDESILACNAMDGTSAGHR